MKIIETTGFMSKKAAEKAKLFNKYGQPEISEVKKFDTDVEVKIKITIPSKCKKCGDTGEYNGPGDNYMVICDCKPPLVLIT